VVQFTPPAGTLRAAERLHDDVSSPAATTTAARPDTERTTWHIPAIIALAAGGFGIGTTEFVTMGLLPDIAGAFSITEPTAGHAVSAYALGVVVGAPIIAAVCASMPRKRLLIGLMTAFAAANVATVLAPNEGAMIAARFVTGLPHGAYFGVASLASASLAPAGRRGKAVAAMMLGLSAANVVGVPAATWLGQHVGWRSAFLVVAVIGVFTVVGLLRFVPPLTDFVPTNPVTELGALRRPQVLLTVAVGAVGFGGMFAVYTYVNTTLTDVAGLSQSLVPVVLMLYGVGMVLGNLVGGVLADRGVDRAIYLELGVTVVVMAGFVFAAQHPITAAIGVLLVGASGAALAPALQTRLMDVAADAQTLAASLNHAALNIANAAGAWLGGLVIAAGYGYTAPAVVGAGLAIAGVLLFTLTMWVARRGGVADG